MQFFKWVESSFSENTVTGFPDEGVEFLNRPGPSDPDLLAFHNELVEFIKILIPEPMDVEVRKHIVETICNRIKKSHEELTKEIIVLPCGSCMTGTFLPTADVDLALFAYPSPNNTAIIMKFLQEVLHDLELDGFNPIPQAKVPVLKFTTPPGIPIDISLNELHGPLCVPIAREIFEKVPGLLPAQIFLKCLLHKHELDLPYSGGISSYTLQLMLLAYVQNHEEPKNITDLIIGFSKFYGTEFNYFLTGIDVSGSGKLFSRYDENKMNYQTPSTMHIIDPLNSENILGHNSFRMNDIAALLKSVYEQITSGRGHELLESLAGEKKTIIEMKPYIISYAIAEGILDNA